MMRSVLLRRSLCYMLSGRTCLLTSHKPPSLQPHSPAAQTTVQQSLHGSLMPQVTASLRYSHVTSEKYTLIYTLPYIKIFRAVSRIKLLQTGITVLILPPMYIFYLQGSISFFLVGYSTGIALFAGAMLYTASHFLRRVVGMMYLDSSQSTLKVSHLTFWGKRCDIYLPVTDVMTIADTGDVQYEMILKLKRYSRPDTLYFSTRFGRVVDKQKFLNVFGSLK